MPVPPKVDQAVAAARKAFDDPKGRLAQDERQRSAGRLIWSSRT